jgi:hypothetical protein
MPSLSQLAASDPIKGQRIDPDFVETINMNKAEPNADDPAAFSALSLYFRRNS